MDRGYWLPPGYRKMAAYGGYYIQADAVYTSADMDACLLYTSRCV